MVVCGNLFGLWIGIKLMLRDKVIGVLNRKLCVLVFMILVMFLFR